MGLQKKEQPNRHPFQRFAFVSSQTNGSSSLQEEKARKILVRSHARRAATKQQRSGFSSNSPEHNISSPKLLLLSDHIQTFRLNSLTTKRRLELRPKVQPKKRAQDPLQDEFAQKIAPKVVSVPPYQLLQDSRHFGLLDPFESFPIPLGQQQRRILHYYTSTLAQSFIAFDPDKELISQAYIDTAWLNAAFSLVALHHDLNVGREISSWCLFHRGEALRIVNERLSSDSPEIMSDSTMGAVASLANFDITMGSISNATVHMDGLQQLVGMRGGLHAVNHNRLVQSLITWSDLLYSAARHSHPRFDLTCELHDISGIPVCVVDLANHREHVENPPGFNVKMRETVRILRGLSLKKSLASASKANGMAFSKCMYLADYRLSTVFDDCASNDISMSIRKPWRLATQLYIHLALRELPGASQVVYSLVKRLKEMLEDSVENPLILWKDNLSLLLWLLFIGSVAANSRQERSYFIERIVRLNFELGISKSCEFKDMLKKVMWLPTFCEPQCKRTWSDVEKKATQMQLPTILGTTQDSIVSL